VDPNRSRTLSNEWKWLQSIAVILKPEEWELPI